MTPGRRALGWWRDDGDLRAARKLVSAYIMIVLGGDLPVALCSLAGGRRCRLPPSILPHRSTPHPSFFPSPPPTAVSVPVKLLKEGEGHVVTAELKSGEVYRGLLVESEDTMNVHLSDVTHTARNGKVRKLEQVYLRGSHLKFIVLPEILKNAPVFKKVQGMKRKETSKTAGRGRGGAFRGGKKRKTGQ